MNNGNAHKEPTTELKDAIKNIAMTMSWENFRDEETGEYWDVKQALYCKMTWLMEYLEARDNDGDEDAMEHLDNLKDVITILEALPKDKDCFKETTAHFCCRHAIE